MLTAILSLAGVGGLGAAMIFIPGFATTLLRLLRGGFALLKDYPWQVATLALTAFGVWSWLSWGSDNRANEAEIAGLTKWQSEVTAAARTAAHHPQLGKAHVAQQVIILGAAIDRIEVVEAEALAKAKAAKRAREEQDERNRKEHDNALPIRIGEERRRTQPWIAAYRLPRNGGNPPRDPGSAGYNGRDLPSPAFGAAQPDGPDRGSDLVAVPVEFVDRCATVTARLKDAQDWAADTLPPPPEPAR